MIPTTEPIVGPARTCSGYSRTGESLDGGPA